MGAVWAAVGAGGTWEFVGAVALIAVLVASTLWRRHKGVGAVRQRTIPRPLRKAMLLPAACAGALAGLGLAFGKSVIGPPNQWIALAVTGIAFTLVVGVAGNWFYRRAYRRWLAQNA